jgi:hypothetical protein
MSDDEKTEVSFEEILAHAPDLMAPVEEEWLQEFMTATLLGRQAAAQSKVVFIGMARSIESVLPFSIQRIQAMGKLFRSWHAVVVENDSIDATKDILHAWQTADPARVRVSCTDYGNRPHLHGWEPERVERYAQYRNEGRKMAQEIAPDADYVIVLDLDAWGGYSNDGVLNSIFWLDRILTAGAMASVSLFEIKDQLGTLHMCHYDQWAFRWESYTHRIREWFTRWIPPIGSQPMLVKSAFGGLCVYKAAPFFASHYFSDKGDIEHVGLHKSLKANGYDVFLNSASRVTMHWIPDDDKKATSTN